MNKVKIKSKHMPMKDVYTVNIHTYKDIYDDVEYRGHNQKVLEVTFSTESQAKLFYNLAITFFNLINNKIINHYTDLTKEEVLPLFINSSAYEYVFPTDLRTDKEKLLQYLEQNPKDVVIDDWLSFWPIHYSNGELYKTKQITIEYYDPLGQVRLIDNFLPMYIRP